MASNHRPSELEGGQFTRLLEAGSPAQRRRPAGQFPGRGQVDHGRPKVSHRAAKAGRAVWTAAASRPGVADIAGARRRYVARSASRIRSPRPRRRRPARRRRMPGRSPARQSGSRPGTLRRARDGAARGQAQSPACPGAAPVPRRAYIVDRYCGWMSQATTSAAPPATAPSG